MIRVDSGEVTRLLRAWRRGDRSASDHLWPLVEQELRQLAAYYFKRERPDHTLQPTAVVNEVYLRLVDQHSVEWRDKTHFMGACAELIRRILVDHARGKLAQKRGGQATRVTLNEDLCDPVFTAVAVLDLEAALGRLATLDAKQERIVELRFFGGLSVKEVAEMLGISQATVKREWAMARAWLYNELSGEA